MPRAREARAREPHFAQAREAVPAHAHHLYVEWREFLFRAICADDVVAVRKLMKKHVPEVDTMVFGCFFAQQGPQRTRRLLAYGAHAGESRDAGRSLGESKDQDDRVERGTAMRSRKVASQRASGKGLGDGSEGSVRNGATALHVAVWKGAFRVTQALMNEGASTSKKDALGVSVFDRAPSRAMSQLLRSPAAPRDVCIVSFAHGRCLLQFTATRSKPRVDAYEVEELVGRKQSWLVDAETGVEVFAVESDHREGQVQVLFHTPKGSVLSASKHAYRVRCRNVDGFWSEWCEGKAKQAPHWMDDWQKDADREQRAEESKSAMERAYRRCEDPAGKRAGKTKLLKLGSVSFGMVRADEWLKRAREQQALATTRIQALARGRKQRAAFVEQMQARRRGAERAAAAKTLQRFYRSFIAAPERDDRYIGAAGDAPELDFYNASDRTIQLSRLQELRRKERRRLRALAREKERYRILKACGYDFASSLPSSWKV